MRSSEQSFLKHRLLNDWALFGVIALLICAAVGTRLGQAEIANPLDISGMIQYSVRLAVPWLFIAFSASSLLKVLPNNLTKWIMRNRRIFGLCFAVAMAWQLFFILWLILGFFEYYMAEAYSYYDLSEQIPGYIILFAMTLTSFKSGRGLISARQWRILHKGGIYFLWYVVWSTYWFELYYYKDIQPIDHVYYWLGMAAWTVRILAWSKKRQGGKKPKNLPEQSRPLSLKPVVAGSFAALGLYLIAFGHVWAPGALDILPKSAFGGWLELFVPLLPMASLYAAALTARLPRPKIEE